MQLRRMRSEYAFAFLLSFALTGCREGVGPLSLDRDVSPGADGDIQLTFSTARDFNPTWSRGSDTVYYTTTRFVDAPELATTAAQIGRRGGVAKLLAPGAQSGAVAHLMLPAVSPDGARVAYVHIPFINQPASCGTTPAPGCSRRACS